MDARERLKLAGLQVKPVELKFYPESNVGAAEWLAPTGIGHSSIITQCADGWIYGRTTYPDIEPAKAALQKDHEDALFALVDVSDRVSAEETLALEILAELVRARTKFPGKNVTFAALVEEVGELATATFEEGRDRVRKEAVQVAVMAMRMVLDGDHTYDAWRAAKGLDALTQAEGEAR